MSDRRYYPDLGEFIDQVKQQEGLRFQTQLAAKLNIRDYDITRAKKLDASAKTQLKVAKALHASPEIHLSPVQTEWLFDFEEWCNDRIEQLTEETWAERFQQLHEDPEQWDSEEYEVSKR